MKEKRNEEKERKEASVQNFFRERIRYLEVRSIAELECLLQIEESDNDFFNEVLKILLKKKAGIPYT